VKKFYQARFNPGELKMEVGYLTCLISQKVQFPLNQDSRLISPHGLCKIIEHCTQTNEYITTTTRSSATSSGEGDNGGEE
jgi:hypothetical protein